MPERSGNEKRTEQADMSSKGGLLGRRRMLQLTGLGIAGTTLAQQVGASSHLPHAIVFDGTGTDRAATYEFGVSDAVEPNGEVGVLESDDAIDGTSVVGSIDGDTDAYRFSGHLTMLDVSGDIDVSLQYGDTTPSGPDRLEILTPADGSVEYTFTCDATVEKVLDNGQNSAEESNDVVTDNGDGTYTVTGLTGNGYGDTYDLSGSVTSFEPATGEFSLLLNGTETTVAELTGQSADGGSETTETLDEAVFRIGFHYDGWLHYSLHVDARPAALTSSDDEYFAASNYEVTELSDGTWLIEGQTGTADPTGPLYGDGYRWEPTDADGILGWQAVDDEGREYVVSINSEEIDPATLPPLDLPGEEETQTLDQARFRVGFPEDAWLEYSLHVDTQPAPMTSEDDEYFAASNYDVSQFQDGTWLVEGQTGTADPSGPLYGDGYTWSPQEGTGVLGWEANADSLDYVVSINGGEVDAADLPPYDPPVQETDSSGGGDVIGGGPGYDAILQRSEADATAASAAELSSALSSAAPGDVVYVTSGFDAGSGGFSVPSGVTVAGDRGLDGSAGPIVSVDDHVSEVFRLSDDARVTGLRIRGVWHDTDFASYQIVYDSGNHTSCGVRLDGASGTEVDNCEIYGFGFASVIARGCSNSHVHHNYIHSTNTDGLGYGVSSYYSGTYPTIEYNYFENNRHSVAAGGNNRGYVCRYNHFGPTQYKHVIDIHDNDGWTATETYIEHNIVEAVEKAAGGTGTAVGGFHEPPEDVIVIADNWAYLPESDALSSGANNYAETRDNYYGTDAAVSFSDIIPGHPGAAHRPW